MSKKENTKFETRNRKHFRISYFELRTYAADVFPYFCKGVKLSLYDYE